MIIPQRFEIVGNYLAIQWSDLSESLIALEKLRKNCPCALCQGESTILTKAKAPKLAFGPKSMELKEIRMIGSYALQCFWGDGHQSGIYPFSLLLELGKEKE
ncbi:DUF971 domain-containing protein [Candidatus Methylacidiphilum fumarolicum]|uniref:Gamma-butyrobetaine hydroxylase-like N-terminal domain-containing protein n=2 Tax=Candidatus Methylacidiphilum fumarolicum TaxID=591154 RepID=I0K179_METFB|nr:DUF971 domain-containing protein [Candidatus Methylacidiphilum fumarolicum]MBW6414995.1 DUF971 domain-containing protein [Candidatus Methylacidiphilum fumarolicum]TFE70319.1 hypothetical protein A7K73_03880 [Candidatus Methylacidiphilum fumarolicum]TFE73994.1 DUF971 domain-containing protein [Candidatus Methylacidiphilum fumarolicum]TFE74501.1 DUF971 domain-containing protein [Candidatus Methylacidiphilum fumarolicum]TFE77831.1 hypothetical protein A7D33_02445 [Candidatus Methylacidiphilum 